MRVKLGEGSKNDVMCDWRTAPIEDIAYLGRKVNRSIENSEEVFLYSKNVMAVKVLEKCMEYHAESEEDGNRSYLIRR